MSMGVRVKFLPPAGPSMGTIYGVSGWRMWQGQEHEHGRGWMTEGAKAQQGSQIGACWVRGDKSLAYIDEKIDELWAPPVDWKRIDRKIQSDMVTKEHCKY